MACLAAMLILPGMRAYSSTGAAATTGFDSPLGRMSSAGLTASFDPGARETHVQGAMAADLCIALRLPENWTLSGDGPTARLRDVTSGAEFEIHARSASELRGSPHLDVVSREAAALQQQYEEILGKPAQAIVHQPTNVSGVSRWSATWIDSNFDAAGHARTVETFIVANGSTSVLEVSLTNVGSREVYDVHVSRMLSSLRTRAGGDCSSRPTAEP